MSREGKHVIQYLPVMYASTAFLVPLLLLYFQPSLNVTGWEGRVLEVSTFVLLVYLFIWWPRERLVVTQVRVRRIDFASRSLLILFYLSFLIAYRVYRQKNGLYFHSIGDDSGNYTVLSDTLGILHKFLVVIPCYFSYLKNKKLSIVLILFYVGLELFSGSKERVLLPFFIFLSLFSYSLLFYLCYLFFYFSTVIHLISQNEWFSLD